MIAGAERLGSGEKRGQREGRDEGAPTAAKGGGSSAASGKPGLEELQGQSIYHAKW